MGAAEDGGTTQVTITDGMIGGFRVEPGVNVRLDRWATKRQHDQARDLRHEPGRH